MKCFLVISKITGRTVFKYTSSRQKVLKREYRDQNKYAHIEVPQGYIPEAFSWKDGDVFYDANVEEVKRLELVAAKRKEINNTKIAKEVGGFTYNFGTDLVPDLVFIETRYDPANKVDDLKTYQTVRGNARYAITNSQEYSFGLILHDDSIKTLTATDILGLVDAVELHIGTTRYTAAQLKNSIKDMTVEQLQNFDPEASWPA